MEGSVKRYFWMLCCVVCGLCIDTSATTYIRNADEITEDWLVSAGNETGYTEHVRHFKKLFSMMKVRGFLEFGCGFSTKYFIDNSEKVISVEFVTPGSGPDWLKYCIDLYRNCKTWTPIAYFAGQGLDTSWAPNKYIGAESVYKAAAYQPRYLKSYALIDNSFLTDLDTFVKQQVADNTIDVAFVDAGVCLRGDLVQVLFNKVPIIAAHDVASKERRRQNDVYGYGRVVVPENYVEIRVPFGMGTAFWVKKEDKYLDVVKGLQDYSNGKS
jgi:hypothetical protein